MFLSRLLFPPFAALSSFPQFPLGRRAACDIYWHGVSFHDNENIVSGQVNKFPGISPLLPLSCPITFCCYGMAVIIRSVHHFNMEIPFWYWDVLMDTLIDLFSQSNRISFECCFPSAFQLTGYILVACICFVHGRNDWNAEEDQHESGSADYAGVVPRRVRLLSPFLDPAWGAPAVFHAGIVT